MTIRWTIEALDDVDRLVDFISVHDPDLANEVERKLELAPQSLVQFPRLGPRLIDFDPREVREYRVDRYVMRYQLVEQDIFVLRIFHAREDRA